MLSRPACTVEEISGAHLIGDDNFWAWAWTNPGDVSIDTANSKEIMTGSHITEQHTLQYQGLVPPELLSMTSNEQQAYDLLKNYQLD